MLGPVPSSGNAATGKLPALWELIVQWGCQTRATNRKEKEAGNEPMLADGTGEMGRLLQVTI